MLLCLGCWSGWENLDCGYVVMCYFLPIKRVNLVVSSPCEAWPYNKFGAGFVVVIIIIIF